jgi:hypothetical protein
MRTSRVNTNPRTQRNGLSEAFARFA